MLTDFAIDRIEAFPQKDDADRRVFTEAKLPTVVYAGGASKEDDTLCRISVHPGSDFEHEDYSLAVSTKALVTMFPETLTIPLVTQPEIDLLQKVLSPSCGLQVREVAKVYAGEICDNAQNKKYLSDEPVGPVVLRGAHVDRYLLRAESRQGADRFLRKEDFVGDKRRGARTFHHEHERVVFQKGAALDNWRRLIAAAVKPDSFCFDTLGYIVPKSIDLHVVLALMNSALWEWMFRCISQTNHVNAYEIEQFRVPDVLVDSSSTTSRELRDAVAQAMRADSEVRRGTSYRQGHYRLDDTIDRLVFDAYGISRGEQEIVLHRAFWWARSSDQNS